MIASYQKRVLGVQGQCTTAPAYELDLYCPALQHWWYGCFIKRSRWLRARLTCIGELDQVQIISCTSASAKTKADQSRAVNVMLEVLNVSALKTTLYCPKP